MERWYLIHAKPSRERSVAVQLHQRGFVIYLPLIWGTTGQLRAPIERPYFPGFLFARLDLELTGVNVVRWTPGVRGLVEANDEPAPIADEFVLELRTRLDRVRAPGNLAARAAWSAALHASDGPWAGYEGILNPLLSGADRAQLLVACIQHAYWRQAAPRPASPRVGDSAAAGESEP
jgi:transcription antitermination factor NusG